MPRMAPYGPVTNRRDEIRCMLVDRWTVAFSERGWGEVLVPLGHAAQPFSVEELALIDEVAHAVNSLSTANELSDFSHRLGSRRETVDGQTIEYA